MVKEITQSRPSCINQHNWLWIDWILGAHAKCAHTNAQCLRSKKNQSFTSSAKRNGREEVSFLKTSSSRPQSSGVMRELAVAMGEFCTTQRLGEATDCGKEKRRMMDRWMDPGTPASRSLGISWHRCSGQPFLGT